MEIGMPVLLFDQLSLSGKTIGVINKIAIPARKEILITVLVGFCCRILDIKIDIPMDPSIIIDIEPNTSNLTNAELK